MNAHDERYDADGYVAGADPHGQRQPEPPESPESPEVTEPPEPADPPPSAPGVTGHPAVDASLRELALVAGAAPADQLPAFQAAHRTLRDTLAGIDEG